MYTRRLVYLVALICISISILSASVFDYAQLALYPRAESMGSATAAQATGLGSVCINPANIANDQKLQLLSSTGKVFEDYTRVGFGFAKTITDNVYVGVTLINAEISGIPRVEKIAERSEILYEATDARSVYMMTLARDWSGFKTGVSLKYYQHQVFDESATGMAADIGGHYVLFPDLTLGAVAHNIGNSSLTWTTGQVDALERDHIVGLSYQYAILFFKGTLNIDAVYPDAYAQYVNTGLEVWLVPKLLAGRMGKQNNAFFLGCGVTIENIMFDYVYNDHEDLGSTHKLGLGAAW